MAAAAVPTWAPLAESAIHPGIQTFTEGAQCTANFVFYAVNGTGFDLYVSPGNITQWKLDGESRTNQLPSRIRNIAPGPHSVMIEAPAGFMTQTQTINVELGKAPRVDTLALSRIIQADAGPVYAQALNPPGTHAHTPPIQQAVAAGHLDVVKLLVERGARLDIRDTIHNSTPLGWANYCGQAEIAAFLRGIGADL